jgi:protein-disulfide isomerase
MFARLLAISCLTLALAACSSAPTKEQASQAVKKIMPASFEILELKEVKDIPHLYEVVVKVDKQVIVIYMDQKLKYVFSGSLMSLDAKINLTAESLKKHQQK